MCLGVDDVVTVGEEVERGVVSLKHAIRFACHGKVGVHIGDIPHLRLELVDTILLQRHASVEHLKGTLERNGGIMPGIGVAEPHLTCRVRQRAVVPALEDMRLCGARVFHPLARHRRVVREALLATHEHSIGAHMGCRALVVPFVRVEPLRVVGGHSVHRQFKEEPHVGGVEFHLEGNVFGHDASI